MSTDFLRSAAPSNSTFRIACGELSIDYKWNVYNDVVLGHLKEGSLSVETEDSSYELEKDDIIFISPNRKFRISKNNGAAVEVILLNLSNPLAVTQEFIPQSAIRGMIKGNCTSFARVSSDEPFYSEMLSDFKAVLKAENEKYDFFQLLIHGKMYNMFFLLFSYGLIRIYDVENQGKKYRALRRVTEYVNENYCETITLDIIAQETGLSRYYVSHLFKELMDTTFVNYLNELRLSRASMLLSTTDIPVIEIAGMSGFNNISNFNRAFKMFYDTTPSKYRKEQRSSQ